MSNSEMFKEGLREACNKYINGAHMALDVFFRCNPEPPEEYAGIRDRSYGFFWCSTILRALGEEEGTALLLKMFPFDRDIETCFFAVFGRSIDNSIALVQRKRLLAQQCRATASAIKSVTLLEKDDILQHSLTSLAATCQWCAEEMEK